jgi:hypothetical protein
MVEPALNSLLLRVARSRILLADCEGLESLAMPGLAVVFSTGGRELAVVGLCSDGRVGQQLADFLRAAAGDGDLGGPLQRLVA